MLELRDVSKAYRSIPAVENVSFTLRQGEVLGYLGPNGSGKSTTVKMVIGLIEPTKGKIFFEGRECCHAQRDNLRLTRRRANIPLDAVTTGDSLNGNSRKPVHVLLRWALIGPG